MANVLTLGPGFLPRPKNPRFSHDSCAPRWQARQRHADRLVAQYLAVHGNKFTDDAERQIERLLFTTGRQR